MEWILVLFAINKGKGIKQWIINWCAPLITINKITTDSDQNYWLKSLETEFVHPNEYQTVLKLKSKQEWGQNT